MTGRPNRRWPAPGEVHRPEGRLNPGGESGRQRFPFNNFTCCLTPFSRCFSSFDHSTCALSVSGRYLALDEIYHPLRAAFPNNSTRRGSFTRARAPRPRRDSHPLRRPIPGHLDGGRTRSILCKLQLGPPRGRPDFKFELLPLHSPLLRQSRLVSYPPLIDMLKFSGYPYLIRGQPKRRRVVLRSPGGGTGRTGLAKDAGRSLGAGDKAPYARGPGRGAAAAFRARPRGQFPGDAGPTHKPCLRVAMTLGQACPPEYQGAQYAFKDSMIH